MSRVRPGPIAIVLAGLLACTPATSADDPPPSPAQKELERLKLENEILAQRYPAYGGTLPDAKINAGEGALTPGAQRQALAAVRFAAQHIAERANRADGGACPAGTTRDLVMTDAALPDLLLLHTLQERYRGLLDWAQRLKGETVSIAGVAEPFAVVGATAELLRYFATETSIGIAQLAGKDQWLTLELAQRLGNGGQRPTAVVSLGAAQLLGGRSTETALWRLHVELASAIAQSPCSGTPGTAADSCTDDWKAWRTAATELSAAALEPPADGQSLLARAVAMQALIGADPGQVRVFIVALDDVLGETVTTRNALVGPKMYFSGSAVARFAVLTGGERRLSGVVSTHCGYSRWRRTDWESRPAAADIAADCTVSPSIVAAKEACKP
jgi:hypothetical protein